MNMWSSFTYAFADVPAFVYSCDTEAEASACTSLSPARNGRLVK